MPEKSHDHSLSLQVEPPEALDLLRMALRGLRFGEVKLIIQDGVVVQVERTERTRPAATKSRRGAAK